MSENRTYRDVSRVVHMQRALSRILECQRQLTQVGFVEGDDKTEIILYNLMILGEAANNVSHEFAELHPDIDFKDMAGLRHKLIHDYANIDLGRIWTILQVDVPVWSSAVFRLAETIPPERLDFPENISDFD